MARTYSIEAIILKKSNFGEADRLITFLPKYKGKFTSVAKGVRKIASRRGPNLELFNHVKAYLAAGKNLDVVTEVETIETFKNVKDDFGKVCYGFHLAEIVNEFLADNQGGTEIFNLLLDTLRLIDKSKDQRETKKLLCAFELKLLDHIGFRPQLDRCLICDVDVRNGNRLISPEFGGVVHTSCSVNTLFTKPISSNGLKVLKFFQREDWPKIERLVVPTNLNSELEQISLFYLEYLLEKELKSSKFIRQVKHLSK